MCYVNVLGAMADVCRVDTTVLPLLFLGLLVFQLDRMNLASALTDGFAKNIHVNPNTINLGNQLMFLGIVVLEIPSNIILQRIGPRIWMSTQVIIFGLVATLQVFVNDKTGFLVSRMFLGLCEAGYIPGGIYTLSTWYTKRQLAKRVAVFFFGMFGGNAISPLLASGILKLGGRAGLTGWQWLFLCKCRRGESASPMTDRIQWRVFSRCVSVSHCSFSFPGALTSHAHSSRLA